jgi:kynurenine formamidase
MRLIDLSVPLQHLAASEHLPARIRYITYDAEGLGQMQAVFGIKAEDLVYSEGRGWAVEQIEAITHTGPHVDPPYHYGPFSEGKPARRIDQVPLEMDFAFRASRSRSKAPAPTGAAPLRFWTKTN